jgi:hypothetical protein
MVFSKNTRKNLINDKLINKSQKEQPQNNNYISSEDMEGEIFTAIQAIFSHRL